MRPLTAGALICLGVLGGCTPQPPTTEAAGVVHYKESHVTETVPCGDRPVQLDGDHTTITLTGACRLVTLAGWHNDVAVAIAPGGTINITGSHNDVYWHQVAPGPQPVLQNHGNENAFHAGQTG